MLSVISCLGHGVSHSNRTITKANVKDLQQSLPSSGRQINFQIILLIHGKIGKYMLTLISEVLQSSLRMVETSQWTHQSVYISLSQGSCTIKTCLLLSIQLQKQKTKRKNRRKQSSYQLHGQIQQILWAINSLNED